MYKILSSIDLKAFGGLTGCDSKIKGDCTAEITTNGIQVKEVNSFKYLGTILSKDSSWTAEICIGIATATAAVAKVSIIWCSNDNRKWLYVGHSSHPVLRMSGRGLCFPIWKEEFRHSRVETKRTAPNLQHGTKDQWIRVEQSPPFWNIGQWRRDAKWSGQRKQRAVKREKIPPLGKSHVATLVSHCLSQKPVWADQHNWLFDRGQGTIQWVNNQIISLTSIHTSFLFFTDD